MARPLGAFLQPARTIGRTRGDLAPRANTHSLCSLGLRPRNAAWRVSGGLGPTRNGSRRYFGSGCRASVSGRLSTAEESDEPENRPFEQAAKQRMAAMLCSVPLANLAEKELHARLCSTTESERPDSERVAQVAASLRNVALDHWSGSSADAFSFVLRAIRSVSLLLKSRGGCLSTATAWRLLGSPSIAWQLGREVTLGEAHFVIITLVQRGISGRQLQGILEERPEILQLPVEKSLEPMLHHLESHYLHRSQGVSIGSLLEENPEVLLCSLDNGCVAEVLGEVSSDRQGEPGQGSVPAVDAARSQEKKQSSSPDVHRALLRSDPFGMAYGLSMKDMLRDGAWWRLMPQRLTALGLTQQDAEGIRKVAARVHKNLDDTSGPSCVVLVQALVLVGISGPRVAQAIESCPEMLAHAPAPPKGSLPVVSALVLKGNLGNDQLLELLETYPQVLAINAASCLGPLLNMLGQFVQYTHKEAIADIIMERPDILFLSSTKDVKRMLLESGLDQGTRLGSLKGLMHEGYSPQTMAFLVSVDEITKALVTLGFTSLQSVYLSEMMLKIQLESQVFYKGRAPSLGDMLETLQCLHRAGVSSGSMYKMLADRPQLLGAADSMGIQVVVALLLEKLSFSPEEMDALVQANPDMLLLSTHKLSHTLDALLNTQHSVKQIRSVLGVYPALITFETDQAVQAMVITANELNGGDTSLEN